MTDVLFIGVILVVLALGILIWYATRKKEVAKTKPKMPAAEFFATVFALINSFLVIVLGIWHIYGAQVAPSWFLAGIFLALGLAGIVFAYVNKFRKRKPQPTKTK